MGEESAGGRKVLVIDDDRPQCEMMAKTLGAAGYYTAMAFSGAEGLERFRAEFPELVVVDFAMPGMNGIEFVNEMRTIERQRTLVLMVAGYAQSFLAALDVSGGVDSYLIKPILPQELVARVADLFAGRF